MARCCEVCGKGASMGNSVTIRGKQKYLGGVGTKITGITRRKFKPNLQRLRVTLPSGANATKLVCTTMHPQWQRDETGEAEAISSPECREEKDLV